MNTTIPTSKTNREIDRQLKEAKAVVRQLQEIIEDLEDIRAFEKAKKRNAGKPGTPWEVAAKELGIPVPKKKKA